MNFNGKASGYSNFFYSGMGFRRLLKSESGNGATVISPLAFDLDITSFDPDVPKPRRPLSMSVNLSRSSNQWHYHSQSRRISLTFLSHLFKRRSRNIAKDESGWLSSSSSNASTLGDIWTTESNTGSSACLSFDDNESKSFYIGIEDTPSTNRGASFLSISSTPSPSLDTSFIRLPRRKRKRPVSIQTMPLPSTISNCNTNTRHSMSIFENPSADIRISEPMVINEEEAVSGVEVPPEEDVPAMICWRQFHLELLAAMT